MFKKITKKIADMVDDINWEIAHFLTYGPEKDGFFASVFVPAVVAFITTLIVIVLTHK